MSRPVTPRRWPDSRQGRRTRRSLGEPLEQLPVLLEDPADALLELGVLTPTLDRLGEGLLDGLVQAGPLGPCERLCVGRELVVESNCQVLCHGFMVSRHHIAGFLRGLRPKRRPGRLGSKGVLLPKPSEIGTHLAAWAELPRCANPLQRWSYEASHRTWSRPPKR